MVCVYIHVHSIHVHIHIYLQFIYSSINGYLNCFYLLFTLNNALVNEDAQISLKLHLPMFWVLIQKWNSGSHSNCMFHFGGMIMLFSTAAIPLAFTSTGHKDSNFSTFLPTLVISCCLFYSQMFVWAFLYMVINPSSSLHQIRKSVHAAYSSRDRDMNEVSSWIALLNVFNFENIWTKKKAECWRIDASELWCWRRLLKSPWTERR